MITRCFQLSSSVSLHAIAVVVLCSSFTIAGELTWQTRYVEVKATADSPNVAAESFCSNSGSSPIEIQHVYTDCLCVSHDLARPTILPGESSTLRFVIDGTKVSTQRLHTFTVVTSDQFPHSLRVLVRGLEEGAFRPPGLSWTLGGKLLEQTIRFESCDGGPLEIERIDFDGASFEVAVSNRFEQGCDLTVRPRQADRDASARLIVFAKRPGSAYSRGYVTMAQVASAEQLLTSPTLSPTPSLIAPPTNLSTPSPSLAQDHDQGRTPPYSYGSMVLVGSLAVLTIIAGAIASYKWRSDSTSHTSRSRGAGRAWTTTVYALCLLGLFFGAYIEYRVFSRTFSDRSTSPAAADQRRAAQRVQGGVPVLSMENPVFDFGSAERGSAVRHQFVIRNKGDAPLLVKPRPACGCTVAKLSSSHIEAGQFAMLEVVLDLALQEGPQSREITLQSNDPRNPALVCALVGTATSRVEIDPRRPVLFIHENDRHNDITVVVRTVKELSLKVVGVLTSDPAIVAAVRSDGANASEFLVDINVRSPMKSAPFKGWVQLVTDHPGEYHLIGIPVTGEAEGARAASPSATTAAKAAEAAQ